MMLCLNAVGACQHSRMVCKVVDNNPVLLLLQPVPHWEGHAATIHQVSIQKAAGMTCCCSVKGGATESCTECDSEV